MSIWRGNCGYNVPQTHPTIIKTIRKHPKVYLTLKYFLKLTVNNHINYMRMFVMLSTTGCISPSFLNYKTKYTQLHEKKQNCFNAFSKSQSLVTALVILPIVPINV